MIKVLSERKRNKMSSNIGQPLEIAFTVSLKNYRGRSVQTQIYEQVLFYNDDALIGGI